jgi:hypothetical protein
VTGNLLIAAGGPGGLLGRYVTDPGGTAARLVRLLAHVLAAWSPAAGSVLAVAVASVIAGRAWLRRRRYRVFADGARQVVILAPPQADQAGAETLWGHLTGLLRPAWARWWYGQPHLGWEYSWTGGPGGAMAISMWVPGIIPPGLVERAVEAAWPGAHAITASPARPALPAGVLATGGTLRLARPEILPLRTVLPSDPLRALAGAAAALGDGEYAVLQVLARPVTGGRLRRARRAARQLRGGQAPRLASRLLDLATPARAATSRRAAPAADPERAADIRAATAKMAALQWDTQIRYVTATTTAAPAGGWRERLRTRPAQAQATARLRGLAHGLASATALYAGPNWLARRRLSQPAERINARVFRRGCLLSVPELAAIAALPADAAVPGLARAGARSVPPPPGIALPGPHARPLGVTDTGAPRPVALAVADGRHHLRIIGATGAGKSTLLTGQVLADAAAGRGAVLIDPKGDAVADILARLPEDAAGRVVLFDPDDRGAPPCLNVLQGDGTGADTDVIVDNLTGIFRRIYAAFWGPRTDDLFRSICLTLLGSVPPGSGQVTLADIPALLTDEAMRRRATATIRDPVLRGFWSWWEELSPASQAAVAGPLMNKLRAFLLRRFARQAIAAGPSTFDMSAVLDKGGLLLARLPKGTLGEETAQLVGSFLVARTWQAAARRARLPQHARPDAALYVDECQNFLNLPYPLQDMLAEARAYRLAVIMAHQDLAQLPPDLREGISANARSQVIFSVSPEDARQLERHTLPQLGAHDLSHLGAWQAAARLVAGSAEQAAFTLRTEPLPPAVPGRARMIRRAARAAYSTAADAAPSARRHDPRSR